MILAQTVLEIYDSEAARDGILDCFLNFDNCQLEVTSYPVRLFRMSVWMCAPKLVILG